MLENLSCLFRWESLGETLRLSFFVGYALLVWFRTNAFVEYVNLFRLDRFFYVSQYNALVEDGYPSGYLDFLKEYFYDQFIVRLAVCPICFGFWVSVIVLLAFGASPLIIPLGLCFYGFFNKLV